jgi:hypothetical protein
MQVVYAKEEPPLSYSKSIFLVGPTPRSKEVVSWRPEVISLLDEYGYDGIVFNPEPRSGNWERDYDGQVAWETRGLEWSDVILAWIPRDIENMPAFTTNVEFGRYVGTGKMIYGRPDNAPKNRYLDWLYHHQVQSLPHNETRTLVKHACSLLSKGSLREKKERAIPLNIWNNPSFSSWLASRKSAGYVVEFVNVISMVGSNDHNPEQWRPSKYFNLTFAFLLLELCKPGTTMTVDYQITVCNGDFSAKTI